LRIISRQPAVPTLLGTLSMKAVLLVAGLGTRLRPITEHTPKCLVPINGEPLLAIWLKKLVQAGVTEVLINTHWLAQSVVDFLAANTPQGLKVQLSHEPQLLGSAGTLLANRAFFGEDAFFIIYGDNLSDVDLAAMRQAHSHYRPVLTLGTFTTDCPQKCGIAEIDSQGMVQGFTEKPDKPVSNCAAAGIYIAEPAIFDYFPTSKGGAELDMGFDIIPKLVGEMRNYPIDLLIDIGTHQNLAKARSKQAVST